MRHLDGLVFFDTAGNFPSGASRPVSVIAARPTRVLRGNIHYRGGSAILRAALDAGPKLAGDHGFPLGGLCGWVDYEGDFVFGDYPEMLVYSHHDQHLVGNRRALRPAPRHPAAPRKFPASPRWRPRRNSPPASPASRNGSPPAHIYQVKSLPSLRRHGHRRSSSASTKRCATPRPRRWPPTLKLDGREILSSSPETFLKISGRGIETRPIKGTRPRFADPDEDRRSAYELQTSAKEIAELVMITDLLRNDLGQVCEFGSVEVAEMLQLESLAQVHHLVSTVTGTLRPEVDAIAALAACFPGGSITGAPKKRAMEIIRELEASAARHLLRRHRLARLQWRELVQHRHPHPRPQWRHGSIYQVGAGIVADSDPEKEYEETLHKAAGIRLAMERWQS